MSLLGKFFGKQLQLIGLCCCLFSVSDMLAMQRRTIPGLVKGPKSVRAIQDMAAETLANLAAQNPVPKQTPYPQPSRSKRVVTFVDAPNVPSVVQVPQASAQAPLQLNQDLLQAHQQQLHDLVAQQIQEDAAAQLNTLDAQEVAERVRSLSQMKSARNAELAAMEFAPRIQVLNALTPMKASHYVQSVQSPQREKILEALSGAQRIAVEQEMQTVLNNQAWIKDQGLLKQRVDEQRLAASQKIKAQQPSLTEGEARTTAFSCRRLLQSAMRRSRLQWVAMKRPSAA